MRKVAWSARSRAYALATCGAMAASGCAGFTDPPARVVFDANEDPVLDAEGLPVTIADPLAGSPYVREADPAPEFADAVQLTPAEERSWVFRYVWGTRCREANPDDADPAFTDPNAPPSAPPSGKRPDILAPWASLPAPASGLSTYSQYTHQTGMGIWRNSASDKLVVYMQGGNACLSEASCGITANAGGFEQPNLASVASKVFSNDPQSPYADWNKVFLPYCSGDWWAGDNDDVVQIGDEAFVFKGRNNVVRYLAHLAATFGGTVDQVVLTGTSAGGYGATFNVERFAQAFPQQDVVLINDSGPMYGADVVPECLEKRFRDVWRIDRTMPASCSECRGSAGRFVESMLDDLLVRYPNLRMGFLLSQEDSVANTFMAFGLDKKNRDGVVEPCGRLDYRTYPTYSYSAAYSSGVPTLTDAASQLAQKLAATPRANLFAPWGTTHGLYSGDWWDRELRRENGTSLTLGEWVQWLLDDDTRWQSEWGVEPLDPAQAEAASLPPDPDSPLYPSDI